MRIAIIGSGVSGIAAGVVLQREGHEVTVFERADRIGGVWSNTYPEVRLQNFYYQYCLSDFPWPFVPDEHPTADQIMRYLEAAVGHFALDVRLEHSVVKLDEAPGGWTVETEAPDGHSSERYDFVVLAVGQFSHDKPNLDVPGRDVFRGEVLTERDVRDLSTLAGRKVAVVGFGKSAVDLATMAVDQHATVSHVFRTARWLFPLEIGPLQAKHMLFSRFGSVMMTSWDHPTRWQRFLHRQLAPMVRSFWAAVGWAFWKHASFTSERTAEARGRMDRVRPRHPLLRDMRSAGALAPAGYYRYVGEGRIEPHVGEVTELVPEGIRLSDQRVVECDTLVLALGVCTPRYPFMPERYRALLESEPDGTQLYRHVIHPRIPRLAFAGFNHCFLHFCAAEVGALWLSAVLSGDLELPPTETMEATIEAIRAWKREHIAFEPARACGVNTRHQHYLDIMLSDLGLSPYRKLPNPFAELFGCYEAADFAGLGEVFRRSRARASRPLRPLPLIM